MEVKRRYHLTQKEYLRLKDNFILANYQEGLLTR